MKKLVSAIGLLIVAGLLATASTAFAKDSFQYRGKVISRNEAIKTIRTEARRKGMHNLTTVNVGKDCSASTVCSNGKVAACSISGKDTSCVCDSVIGCSCTVYLPNGDIDGNPAPCD
ncbi:MAG: hypothetical protein LJE67_05560 [Salaquimonas sp.]|nr:hypothetical protein [Salaquimonas sp.]